MLVQAFIAYFTVEAFCEAVFRWLAGRDIVPLHIVIRYPLQNCLAGKFRTIVADGLP